MIATCTLKLADGSTVTGAIHGSGGIIAEGDHNRARVEGQIRRATEGDPLGIYEPKPGHCRMYLAYSALAADEPIDVDLRGAVLL